MPPFVDRLWRELRFSRHSKLVFNGANNPKDNIMAVLANNSDYIPQKSTHIRPVNTHLRCRCDWTVSTTPTLTLHRKHARNPSSPSDRFAISNKEQEKHYFHFVDQGMQVYGNQVLSIANQSIKMTILSRKWIPLQFPQLSTLEDLPIFQYWLLIAFLTEQKDATIINSSDNS
jgi:hypothetical protein